MYKLEWFKWSQIKKTTCYNLLGLLSSNTHEIGPPTNRKITIFPVYAFYVLKLCFFFFLYFRFFGFEVICKDMVQASGKSIVRRKIICCITIYKYFQPIFYISTLVVSYIYQDKPLSPWMGFVYRVQQCAKLSNSGCQRNGLWIMQHLVLGFLESLNRIP